jgi:GMP synthase-like glutamine amidotransferase
VAGYRALAVLGGEWSANDERPSLRQAEALIRQADALGIPVLGHCLGAQLMARAWGGVVQRLPQPEIGWLPIEHDGSAAAREWLGDGRQPTVYQWHYDGVVTLPAGASVLAASKACAVQAFVRGPHLAMQFHIEITPLKIEAWLADPGQVYPRALQAHIDTVQAPEPMRQATREHQAASYRLADRIYAAWQRRWRPLPGGG